MAEDDRLAVTSSVKIPRHELDVKFTTSGGPGGQHANKTATRAELTFNVAASGAFSDSQRERVTTKLGSVIRVVVDDERSQIRNRALAEERLADRLRAALHVERTRRPTRPTRGSQQRRIATKKQRSDIKRDRRRPTTDEG